MSKEISREQFISALKVAPPAVRSAVSSDATTDAIGRIQKTYNLHIDTTGKIARQVGYMLLGLLEPTAFYGNLLGFGLAPESANAIIKDVNVSIFLPLQARIRAGGVETEDEDEPEAEYDPSTSEAPSVPVQTQATSQVPVMNVAPQPAFQTPPNLSVPPPYNLIQPEIASSGVTPVAFQPAAPVMRTMQHDLSALSHGEVPGQYSFQTGPMQSINQTTPASAFQTASVPHIIPTPAPSRPIEQNMPLPVTRSNYPPTPIATPSPKPTSQGASSDPYRESI